MRKDMTLKLIMYSNSYKSSNNIVATKTMSYFNVNILRD